MIILHGHYRARFGAAAFAARSFLIDSLWLHSLSDGGKQGFGIELIHLGNSTIQIGNRANETY